MKFIFNETSFKLFLIVSLTATPPATTKYFKDLPVISFEQHISRENVNEITSFLREFDYRVFMVNEVLPGNTLDCRNFLALPSKRGLPKLPNFDQEKSRGMKIFSAVIGDALIEI